MAGGTDTSSRAGPSRSRKRPVSVNTTSRDLRSKRPRTRGVQEAALSMSSSRPRNKRKRSLKGKEKAESSSEDEAPEPASNDGQQAAEDIEGSASQSSSVSTPSNIPSSSATSLESEDTALTRAQRELALKNEVRGSPRVRGYLGSHDFGQILKKQNATFTALQGILQCAVCLEMLWRPYS